MWYTDYRKYRMRYNTKNGVSIMSNVKPRAGGPYSLFCSDCGCWVPNLANYEMLKEGYYTHHHTCYNGICDMKNGEKKLDDVKE